MSGGGWKEGHTVVKIVMFITHEPTKIVPRNVVSKLPCCTRSSMRSMSQHCNRPMRSKVNERA